MKKFRGGFDKAAIKRFFVQNVEKMAFGLSMLCVALLFYSAIKKAPYDKVPKDIEDGINNAKSHIARGVIDKERDGIVTPKYEEMAQRSGEAVPNDDFFKPVWEDPIRKVGTKREEPVLLAVRDLTVHSGSGPFAFIDPDAALKATQLQAAAQAEAGPGGVGPNRGVPGQGEVNGRPTPRTGAKKPPANNRRDLSQLFNQQGEGAVPDETRGEGMQQPGMTGGLESGEARGVSAPQDSLVKGQQWVCITGLVPFKDQIKKYVEQFENAQYVDPSLDAPDYVGYFVERAEVPEGESGDPAKLKWVRLQSMAALQAAEKDWSVMAPEVVDPNLTLPALTFPLGPLLGRNWSKDAAHPKIPVLDPSLRGQAQDPNLLRDAAASEEPAANDLEAFKRRDRSAVDGSAGGVRGQPARMGRDATMQEGGGRGYGGGYGRMGIQDGASMGRQMPMPRGRMQDGEGYGATTGMEIQQDLVPENLLFRFFDFSVQEGRRYRYRVQLVVGNPNFQVRARFLKSPELADGDFRFSEWSLPSPTASVTNFDTILAGAVKPADKSNEVRANVVVVQLDKDLGVKAIDECRDPRRAPGKPPEKKPMAMLFRGQLLKYTADVDVFHPLTHSVEKKQVHFAPNVVLLDLKGGEALSTNPREKDKAPGEMLFLDANGVLIVKSELEDESSYQAEVGILQRLEDLRNGTTQGGDQGGEGALPTRGRRGSDGS